MSDPLPPDRLETRFHDKGPLYSEAQARAEADRCLYCSDAPCVKACPTEINIPEFIRKIGSGNLRGSARTIFEQNLLGWSCARVCPVEVLCVGSCVYNGFDQEPIAIGRLQRYATERAGFDATRPVLQRKPPTGRKVACVGAGPAGLAFAGYMALEGHEAVVYERAALPGGLNTTGVAPYKIRADEALREVEAVLGLGAIEVKTGAGVGPDGVRGEDLLSQYDAVFIGVGLGPDTRLGVPGEAGPGVVGAITWIESLKLAPPTEVPARVLVIGGGNTALDVARECAGLGVKQVAMAYRRDEAAMSGYAHELAGARKEAVVLLENATPVEFLRDGGGGLVAVKLARTGPDGRPLFDQYFEHECDLVVLAIGQSKLREIAAEFPGVEVDKRGCVVVDGETRRTGNAKVFAGGDCVNGGKEVVNAVADGRDAARWLSAQWQKEGV